MEKERKEAINKYLLGVKHGDEASLSFLYDEIAPTIRYIALKYIKNKDSADDLVQDFWADIKKLSMGFVRMQNGFSYLCKAMTRRAINRYKRLKLENKVMASYVDYGAIADANCEADLYETRLVVESAMSDLSELEKIIIQLTYFEQKTVREVADELHLSKSYVERLKLKAINSLKSKFVDFLGDKSDV